jgi:prephenate dehydrogenase
MSGDVRPLPLVPGGLSRPVVFERVGIVGLGRLGASVALASRRAWPSALVVGVDDHEVLERAVRLHAIDVGAPDVSIVSGADLVVLARSDAANAATLADLPAHVDGAAVVTVIDGAGPAVRSVLAALPARLVFVDGGAEVPPGEEGIDAARADLFAGRPWRLAAAGPTEAARDAARRVAAFARALGAEPMRA